LAKDGISTIPTDQGVRKAGFAAGEAMRVRAYAAKGAGNVEKGAEGDQRN
jgi:hypothetical protein